MHRQYKNIKALSIEVPEAAINGLKNNPHILIVEKDAAVKTNTQVMDWGITTTNTPNSWGKGITGKGIKVAVVDTGIAPHDDLVIAGGTSFTNYTTSYKDDNGHGTHVAGVIGAKNNTIGAVGVAPDCQLYAVKVLESNGSGYMSNVIAGVDWSITNKMDIVNLSLGSNTGSYALQNVIDEAYSRGISIVAAAGNDGLVEGTGDTVDYPARYSSAIAVGAITPDYARASFSSTGTSVEVSAPGVNILSTIPGNRYGYMSGTSMATPYVAGILALYRESNPGQTALTYRQLIIKNVKDLGTAGKDNWFGNGLALAPIATSTVAPVPTPGPTSTITNSDTAALVNTITTITTNKVNYLIGETVHMTIQVKAGSAFVSNATTITTIEFPNTSFATMTLKGRTNINGRFYFAFVAKSNYPKGIYKIKTTTTKINMGSSSALKSFSVQ